jgi:hypothetical protein
MYTVSLATAGVPCIPLLASETSAVHRISPSGPTRRISPLSPGITTSPSGSATALAFAAVWPPVLISGICHSISGDSGIVASG